MEQERTNRNCPLWGTETCARLNMRACRGCPAEDKDARECDFIRDDIDTLYSLLPAEGIHSLFSGEECALCKGEWKRKKESYALFDMGHADPRTTKKKLSLFRNKTYGFAIPLQFGCCRDCRRRFQLIGWLPMLTTIVILGAALLVVAQEPVAQSLRNVWRGLPLVVMVLAALLSWGLGKVFTNALRARFNRHTCMDLRDHPMVQRMMSLGWETILEGKYPQPMFTRKRLSYGVGTAVPQTAAEPEDAAAPQDAAEKNMENGENLD